ncbi:hypothetical protein ACHWQZ_G007223 [Mnemiopsis leidyi]
MIVRAITRCRLFRNSTLQIRNNPTLSRHLKLCRRDLPGRCYSSSSKSPGGIITKVVHGVKSNISGYTRVLIVMMGIMTVIVIVAEQTIAQDQIILNVLPQKPSHQVFTYPLSVFDDVKTEKQFIQARSHLVNIHGPRGCGKTEFVRQYSEHFLQEGPHLYFKLHKLSNRRNCQVFTLDARNSQTLAHSLTSLNNKLKQNKGTDGATENHNLIQGISRGLEKQSRWLLIFENATPDLNLPELLSGYENWGDGQIIITSDSPLPECNGVSLTSLIPRATAEKAFFSIAPTGEVFDSSILHKLFGNDLRAITTAAYCIKLEQENGIDFDFESLSKLLAHSTKPSEDVIRLYCSLIALEKPKLLLALDFIAKLPADIPVPYKYIKHHLTTNMYDNFLDVIPGYSLFRISKCPKKTFTPVETVSEEIAAPVDPSTLSFMKRKRHEMMISLGMDPSKDFMEQLKEVTEVLWPKPMTLPDDIELVMLRDCPLLKFNPEYGGHVPVFNVDESTHALLQSVHTDFTVHLLEAALVYEQEERYNRTWMSKIWTFRQHEQTLKSRQDVLGKAKVHLDPKNTSLSDICPQIPVIYEQVLKYKATPISRANLAEYSDLHHKQVLKSVMSFVDVTIPNTVQGTMESIILHGHLSGLSDNLPPMFSGLAETCSLHLKSELGGSDMETDFKSVLSKAREVDFKGPSHASALHRYAAWLHNNSRDAEAKELLDEAVRFADSIALNKTMAQVCCELEDHESAEKYLEKAVNSVKPGDQDILGPLLTDLGQVMLLQGKTSMGIKYLQGAIEGYKNQVGTEDPEYVRALNVVSIGHLMLGDNLRANRARNEASSVLAKLKKKNLIV